MNRSESQLRTNPRIVPPDLLLKFGYPSDTGIKFDSAAETLSFYQGGTQRVDIRSFGLAVRNGEGLVVGHTSQITAGGVTAEMQVLGTAAADSSLTLGRFSGDAQDASLKFVKGRDAIGDTTTVLADGDFLGEIRWHPVDATDNDFASTAALIHAELDGDPGQNDFPTALVFSTAADGSASASEALRIDSSQNLQMRNESYLWIGPDSAATGFVDSKTTVGLVINQEANSDDIITLKSSAVAHPITGFVEADTFGRFRKSGATYGGLMIEGYTDADSTTGNYSLRLRGLTGDTALDNTRSTAGLAAIVLQSYISDGGISVAAPGANQNLLVMQSGSTTRFIFDSDGDSHQDVGTAWTNFDDEPDALIARSLGIVMDQASVIRTQWDDWGRDHKEDLIRTGIIPRLTAEQEANGEHALVNTSQVMRLHNGAIWQQHTAHMSLVERVDELVGELALANKQLAALTA